MESAEQVTATLHENIKPELTQMGHRGEIVATSETPFPLTNDLKQIGVDARHIAGSTFHDVLGGTSTYMRETSSRNPFTILRERTAQLLRRKK